MLFIERFSAIFKISDMQFILKNVLAKRDEAFIWEKTSHHSEIPFYEREIPVRWDNLFLSKQILIFNGILLQDEILLNRCPHFAGMFFLNISTP